MYYNNIDKSLTVKDLTPRKSEQSKAHAAAAYAYGGQSWRVARDIYSAYSKPSAAKVSAWEDCKALCAAYGGFDLCISSHNTMKFSAVFKYWETETGALCYCYITREHTRHCYAA